MSSGDATSSPLPPITSAADAWDYLALHAGMETRLAGKSRPRDESLPDAVLSELLKDRPARTPHADLRALLADPAAGISIEDLVLAVLGVVRPYSRMMSSILETLALAGAASAGDHVRLRFNFDEHEEPLVETLKHFRETAQRTIEVLQRAQLQLPPTELLRQINSKLRELLANFRFPDWGSLREDFDNLPDLEPSGHQELDGIGQALVQSANLMRRFLKSQGANRRAVYEHWRQALDAAPADPVVQERFAMAADGTDFQDSALWNLAGCVADGVREGALDGGDICSELRPLADRLPRRDEWLSQTLQDLLDILNLPVWQRRHELYSVWVGCHLLQQAKRHAEDFHFHTPDGELSFSFGGSKLGSYTWNAERFDVWAELRSDLVKGLLQSKRQEGIQPDFRVLKAGIYGDNDATRLVLEVKHYLRPGARNFTEAVNDYARSCRTARVALVNYGPLDEATLRPRLEPGRENQVHFFGDVRPDADDTQVRQFDAFLAGVLFPPAQAAQPAVSSARPSAGGRISLSWKDDPQDLDLYVQYTAPDGSRSTVCYSSPPGSNAQVCMTYQGDVRHGPGREEVVISEWRPGSYDVFVKEYDKRGRMRRDQVRVEIEHEGGKTTVEFAAAASGLTCWHVCRIHRRGEAIEVVNDFQNADLV